MPAPKKHPEEFRERAVRMVFEVRERTGQSKGAIARVAGQQAFAAWRRGLSTTAEFSRR